LAFLILEWGVFLFLERLKISFPMKIPFIFADTGRRRYGTKSEKEVLKYVFETIRFLISKKAKAIVIACNTAATVFLNRLRINLVFPLWE